MDMVVIVVVTIAFVPLPSFFFSLIHLEIVLHDSTFVLKVWVYNVMCEINTLCNKEHELTLTTNI